MSDVTNVRWWTPSSSCNFASFGRDRTRLPLEGRVDQEKGPAIGRFAYFWAHRPGGKMGKDANAKGLRVAASGLRAQLEPHRASWTSRRGCSWCRPRIPRAQTPGASTRSPVLI